MNKKLIEKAKRKLSRECTVEQAKVACIVLRNGMPLFITTNKRGEGRVSKWSIHAEEDAIGKLWYLPPELLNNISVIVLRMRKDGSLAMAKPCPGCANLLEKEGIPYHYTDDTGRLVYSS